MLVVCAILILFKIVFQQDLSMNGTYKDYKDYKKQQHDFDREKKYRKYIRLVIEQVQYTFILLIIIFFFFKEQNNALANAVGIIGCIIFSICEILFNALCINPFISIFSVLGLSVVLTLIGNESSILNWAFLGLVLTTTIGGNFFDKTLIEGRVTKEIKDEDIIFRKITHYIGIVFLYVGIYISGYIITSPSYFVLAESKFTSEFAFLNFLYSKVLEIITKALIFSLVWLIYFRTKNIILNIIFRCCYQDKELKIRGKLIPVLLKDNTWISSKFHLNKYTEIVPSDTDFVDEKELKRIGINTYQKQKDLFYVEDGSEILNNINRKPKYSGYPILGKLDRWTIILIILILIIIPINKYIDSLVTVDDGIYKIEEKPDKAEVPNEIEVLGDAIVYNGKVEAFDTHTQSFEHGTISIRKKDKHSIELTKNVGDKTRVVYQKMDANGIPNELQEKYTGHSKNPGHDGLIFSEGGSTLIFDKKDNKITNKTEDHPEPFVVIPEDKLDGEAKGAFNKHKSEYKGAYFIFTANKKYDKDSSNVYVAVLSDGGKTIQINELEYSGKDDDSLYRFTGKAE
jgi:membrane protein